MNVIQITAQLSNEELTNIVRAGFRSLDKNEAEVLGQRIAEVGARFIRAVIDRNELDNQEVARRLRQAAEGLATASEALGLSSRAITSTASLDQTAVLLDNYTQSIRPYLFGFALVEQQGASDLATQRAQANERLNSLVQSLDPLRSLVERAARRVEVEIARPRRRSEKRFGLSRAIMGRLPVGATTRADNALEHFLRDIWEIYLLALPRGVPKTSVGAPTRRNRGKASGPFIRFCRASIDWVLTQVPEELFARDAKLRKVRRLTDGAIRARVQRAVDFGTMRRRDGERAR
jgi:hypothetical protein